MQLVIFLSKLLLIFQLLLFSIFQLTLEERIILQQLISNQRAMR